MNTKYKSAVRAGCHSFWGVVCTGAILLMAASAPGQNLFVDSFFGGNIYEFTPGGVQSTFASGVSYPSGMAFDSAGNLFVVEYGNGLTNNGDILEFAPNGTQSTFASGLYSPQALAIQPVPEPSALGMLAVGATVFLVRRRR
jgi:hypothetical protein